MSIPFIPFSLANKDIRILVADDMNMSRMTAKKLLGELGFKNIEMFENGKLAWEALVKAKESGKPFSLVISDWVMPEMDGIQFLQCIRNSQWDLRPHFVILTAETSPKQVALALEEGISAYVPKPVVLAAFKQALEGVEARSNKKAA